VFAILTKTYKEELGNYVNKDFEVDMEKPFFDLHNNLIILQKSSDINNKLLFYSGKLISLFTFESTNFDKYITNIEAYFNKLNAAIDSLRNNETELMVYKHFSLELIGLIFDQTESKLFSNNTIIFILDLIFSQIFNLILNNSEYLIKQNEENRDFFVNIFSEEILLTTMGNIDSKDKKHLELFIAIKENLSCFYKFMKKITTDITTGKKLWKSVEDLINLQIKEQNVKNLLFQMTLIFIFVKTRIDDSDMTERQRKVSSDNNNKDLNTNYLITNNKSSYTVKLNGHTKHKIILSSIFEFLCEKLSSTKIVIPCKKKDVVSYNNLNLFHDMIIQFFDVVITDNILNDRYTQVIKYYNF